MRLPVATLVTASAVCVLSLSAQQPEAALTPSQQLLKQFSTDKNSVAYAAVEADLRNDINAYAKAGKKTELVLHDDAKFNDGSIIKKGTVISGEVISATPSEKAKPTSTLVLDWTEAELPKKQKETLAVIVRDAKGAQAFKQTDRSFGENQLGASSNSGRAGDKLSTEMNLILLNQKEGMPQIAPGVQMIKQDRHSLSVAGQGETLSIHEGTQFIVILFKAREAK